MKFWGWLLVLGFTFGGGFIAGRFLPHGADTGAVGVDRPKASDGGVPSATATATAQASACDAGVSVTVLPGKPYVIYLPADAGTVTCPACPTFTIDAEANSNGGKASASSDAPLVGPVVVTKFVDREVWRAWGLGPALTYVYRKCNSASQGGIVITSCTGGNFGLGVSLTWQPLPWLENDLSVTTNSALLDAKFRFNL